MWTNYYNKCYAFAPLQLFHVKKSSKPKADKNPIIIITLFAYLAGIVTFIALAVTQSKSYSTETSIKVTDISDDEWTCSMASLVTESLPMTTAEPSKSYNLMKVNELKGDCLNNLYTANPCANISSILFNTGPAYADYYLPIVSASPVSTADSNTFYFSVWTSQSHDLLQSYKYDVSTNTLTEGNLGSRIAYAYPFETNTFNLFCSVAMSKSGQGYFVSYDEDYVDLRDFDGTLVVEDICPELKCDGVSLTNDNQYNVYLMQSNGSESGQYDNVLSRVNTGDDDFYELSSILTITTEGNATIPQFAVYHSGSHDDEPTADTIYVYYVVAALNLTQSQLWLYYQGKSTFLFDIPNVVVKSLQIASSENKVYFLANRVDIYSCTPDGTVELLTSYSIQDSNFYSFQLVLNDSNIIYASGGSAILLYQQDLSTNLAAVFGDGFTDSTVGWFVCGNQVQSGSLPVNAYTSSCASNGITWQFQYSGDYFATSDGFEKQAKTFAYDQCNSTVYDAICDMVENLPPYICTHKVYLPIFTVLATAIANSHLVITVLFMAAGYALSQWSKRSGETEIEKTNEEMIQVPLL